MRLLVLGCGKVGSELARRARGAGWEVVGTTTTPARVAELRDGCDDVAVLTGDDAAAVAAAADGCDAIAVTVSPRLEQALTPEARAASYEAVLVGSARSAVAANPRTVLLSSTSVYGAGDGAPNAAPDAAADRAAPMTEATPVAATTEPSNTFFRAAEAVVLASARGAVLRSPDIYGHPADLSFADRVRFAHERMGGRVPFAADALLYRAHYEDVARAALAVLDHDANGVFNVVPDGAPPPTNRAAFDELCARIGVPPLEFLGQISAPRRPISSARLRSLGFAFEHEGEPLV